MATRADKPPPTRRFGRKEPPKPVEPPKKDEPPEIVGQISDFTINQGQKVEYAVKINGSKPLTVTWYRNETIKLKSSQNAKITFAQGEAKLIIMEAVAEDDGEYKIEATNAFGKADLKARVTVILPEKVQSKVKQKAKPDDDVGESVDLKKGMSNKRESVGSKEISDADKTSLGVSKLARGSRGSVTGGGHGGAGGPGMPAIPSIVVDGGTSPGGSRRGSMADGDLGLTGRSM